MFGGTGSPLQAVIFGDQGEVSPSQVKTPSVVKITMTDSTAIGRRLGARSPRPKRNGIRNRKPMPRTGATRIATVSHSGGMSDRTPKVHRNGQSGRGLAPGTVGSGGPEG